MKILLERGDVNPDLLDRGGRTPLSYAAGCGHEGIVKILLDRGDVDSGSSDNDGRTPLVHAERSGKIGVVRLLSEPRPFSHRTSQTGYPTLKVSSPTPSSQDEVEPSPASHYHGILPGVWHEITEATPLPLRAQCPLYRLQLQPLVSARTPIPTSPTPPDSTIPQHSRPSRGCTTAFLYILHQVKHSLFPSS